MRVVVEHQPAIAYAVHCLTLFDQLELTPELLKQDDWPDFNTLEPLRPNVVRFRPAACIAMIGVLRDILVNLGLECRHQYTSGTLAHQRIDVQLERVLFGLLRSD
jgi:hypothetical protein